MYKITDAHTHEQKNAALYTFDLGQVKIHIYIQYRCCCCICITVCACFFLKLNCIVRYRYYREDPYKQLRVWEMGSLNLANNVNHFKKLSAL